MELGYQGLQGMNKALSLVSSSIRLRGLTASVSALPPDSGGLDRPVCALHETAEGEGGGEGHSTL